MTNSIEKLAQLFKEFPGIGPRQAKRFAYHLLNKDDAYVKSLGILIFNLKKEIIQCPECYRFYPPASAHQREKKICELCTGAKDSNQLLVVEKDVDLDNIRKSGVYHGRYFVLGSLLPILEKHPEKKIRIMELEKVIERRSKDLNELVIAVSANAEGDNTIDFLRSRLRDLLARREVKLSVLGRGLSTGAELEYSDTDTLKNALKNRS